MPVYLAISIRKFYSGFVSYGLFLQMMRFVADQICNISAKHGVGLSLPEWVGLKITRIVKPNP